jgi:hypothetical protein
MSTILRIIMFLGSLFHSLKSNGMINFTSFILSFHDESALDMCIVS